jgi:hypothetical protein
MAGRDTLNNNAIVDLANGAAEAFLATCDEDESAQASPGSVAATAGR